VSGKEKKKEETSLSTSATAAITPSSPIVKEGSGSNLKRAATTSSASSIGSGKETVAPPLFSGSSTNAYKRRKTKDEIMVDIRQELETKRTRPLAKCSVGSDLPRFIRKIILVDGAGEILWNPPHKHEHSLKPVTDDIYAFLRAAAEYVTRLFLLLANW